MDIDIVLLVLIIANVAISIKGFNDTTFFNKYKFQVGPIHAGEKVRMLTSAFLHVDFIHLILNMYVLYIFAPIIIVNLGQVKFLLIYFGSLFAGGLLSFMYHKNESYYSAVGASGAVAGVIYAAILLDPRLRLGIFPLPFYVPGYVFGIGYLLYSIYGMKKQIGNVGHAAHLGGAIGGYTLLLALNPSVFLENKFTVLILGVPIVLLLVFGNRLK